MRTIQIFAYQPLGDARPPDLAPAISIRIETPMPHCETIPEQDALLDEQSVALADVLIHHLPSGTLHRLTALLIRHSAGVLCLRDEDLGKQVT